MWCCSIMWCSVILCFVMYMCTMAWWAEQLLWCMYFEHVTLYSLFTVKLLLQKQLMVPLFGVSGFCLFVFYWGGVVVCYWGCFVSSARNALKLSMQMPRAHHWTSMCTEKLGNSDFATRCRAGTFWKRHFEGCKRHVTHLKLLGASCSHHVFIGEWLLTCV